MIDDNTRRIQIPDGEVKELTSHDGLLWERAVSEIKGRLEDAYVTRDNGIQHLKAFGATPVKHKAEKLWGRWVPAVASDTTTYPMVLTGYATLVANGTEDYTSPTIAEGKLYRNTATAGIADNSKFSYCSRTYLPATQTTRTNHSQYFTSAFGYCDFIDNDYSSVASFKAALASNPVTILYALATSDGSAWKFVKDIGLDGTGTDFGYYNEATGEFVKAQGASGTVIQPISYAESTGMQYVDTNFRRTLGNAYKAEVDAEPTGAGSFFTLGADYIGYLIREYSDGTVGMGGTSKLSDGNTRKIYTIELAADGINSVLTTSAGSIFNTRSGANYGYNVDIGRSYGSDYGKAKYYGVKLLENSNLVRDYLPVRIGTTVELLDLVNWQFAQRKGTFTAGTDIQIVPDVIEVNTGDLKYGQYGNKYGIFTDGTHKVKLSKDGTQIAERNIPMLLSEDSFVDIQTGNKSEAWGIKVLDGTESEWTDASTSDKGIFYVPIIGRSLTIKEGLCSHFDFSSVTSSQAPDGSMFYYSSSNIGFRKDGMTLAEFKSWLASEYAKGTPVIILYPLATPITDQVTIAPIASARRTTYVADSESELGKLNLELKFLGK